MWFVRHAFVRFVFPMLQGVDMSEAEVAAVMATIDEDGGGDIDLGEFTNWFLGLDTKKEGEKISKIGATQCRFVSRIACARCASQLPPGDRPSSLPSP